MITSMRISMRAMRMSKILSRGVGMSAGAYKYEIGMKKSVGLKSMSLQMSLIMNMSTSMSMRLSMPRRLHISRSKNLRIRMASKDEY